MKRSPVIETRHSRTSFLPCIRKWKFGRGVFFKGIQTMKFNKIDSQTMKKETLTCFGFPPFVRGRSLSKTQNNFSHLILSFRTFPMSRISNTSTKRKIIAKRWKWRKICSISGRRILRFIVIDSPSLFATRMIRISCTQGYISASEEKVSLTFRLRK